MKITKITQVEKLGWNIDFSGTTGPLVETPAELNGYSYIPKGELELAIKEWQDQIKEENSPEKVGSILYWEMIDWLDDYITENKDDGDEWLYRVKVNLNSNGECIVTWL